MRSVRLVAAICHVVAPLDQPAFCPAGPGPTTPAGRNSPQIAPVVSGDEVPAKSALFAVSCQRLQRLLKTLDRDDLEATGVFLCILRVLACGDEEVIHIRATPTDETGIQLVLTPYSTLTCAKGAT